MSIRNVRRINLQTLVAQEGSTEAVAKKVGTSPGYVNQVISSVSRGDVGNRFAAAIEKAFEMPEGWLDQDHELIAASAAAAIATSAAVVAAAASARKAVAETEKSGASAIEAITALEAIQLAAKKMIDSVTALRCAIEEEATQISDLPGVKRVGPSAVVVSSAALFATGTLSQFPVDAPRQAARIAEIVGEIISAPSRTASLLGQIIANGEEKEKVGGVRNLYDNRVVERFMPILQQAADVAKLIASMQSSAIPAPSSASKNRP